MIIRDRVIKSVLIPPRINALALWFAVASAPGAVLACLDPRLHLGTKVLFGVTCGVLVAGCLVSVMFPSRRRDCLIVDCARRKIQLVNCIFRRLGAASLIRSIEFGLDEIEVRTSGGGRTSWDGSIVTPQGVVTFNHCRSEFTALAVSIIPRCVRCGAERQAKMLEQCGVCGLSVWYHDYDYVPTALREMCGRITPGMLPRRRHIDLLGALLNQFGTLATAPVSGHRDNKCFTMRHGVLGHVWMFWRLALVVVWVVGLNCLFRIAARVWGDVALNLGVIGALAVWLAIGLGVLRTTYDLMWALLGRERFSVEEKCLVIVRMVGPLEVSRAMLDIDQIAEVRIQETPPVNGIERGTRIASRRYRPWAPGVVVDYAGEPVTVISAYDLDTLDGVRELIRGSL